MPPAYTQPLPQHQSNEQLTGYLGDVLGGKYLEEGNPYLQQVVDRTTRDAQAGFDQQRANLARQTLAPGRLGSSFHQQAMQTQQGEFGQGLADALAGLRFGAYESERGRQGEAAQLSQARDQAMWGDLTQRYGIDSQLEGQKAAAAAQRAAAASAAGAHATAARYQAQAQQAATKARFLAQMGQLQEQSRQFDATLPLQYGGLAADVLGTLGGQDLQGAGLAGDMALGQMGQQLGAAGLGVSGGQAAGALNQGLVNQQLAGAGMIPGLANADLAGMGLAGDYFTNLGAQEAAVRQAQIGASASRHNAGLQDQWLRDQAQAQSVYNQFGAGDPTAALNTYLSQIGLGAGMAGGTSSTQGVQPGQAVPAGPGGFMGGLQGGIGGALTGFGLANSLGAFGGPPPILS